MQEEPVVDVGEVDGVNHGVQVGKCSGEGGTGGGDQRGRGRRGLTDGVLAGRVSVAVLEVEHRGSDCLPQILSPGHQVSLHHGRTLPP